MSKLTGGKGGRGEQTTNAQRNLILQWLEIPANFALVTGDATKNMSTVIAGAKLSKNAGYKMLSIFINQHLPTSNWSQDNAGTRLKSYVALYKKNKDSCE
jgi:hypothetical protein